MKSVIPFVGKGFFFQSIVYFVVYYAAKKEYPGDKWKTKRHGLFFLWTFALFTSIKYLYIEGSTFEDGVFIVGATLIVGAFYFYFTKEEQNDTDS